MAEDRETGSAAPKKAPVRAHGARSESDESFDELVGYVRAVVDSRIVCAAVLVAMALLLLGPDNLLGFFLIVFVGYVLSDRFLPIRRCIVIGGTAWAATMLLGSIVVSGSAVPIFFDAGYFFAAIGLFLAIAVCGVFFAGRAMYYYGLERGEERADRAIAAHVVNRLIDNPDDWGHLDGDYLEVEGALNRVRERERASQQALRDEARRKDDLVAYLAHDLKTPLASVVGYLSLLDEAPDLPVEQRARFTGVALEKAHRLDALIEEFFDITRFDFHDIVLTRGYVDLSLLLAQVADEFYPALAEQHKEVAIDTVGDLVVLVDGDKMARVFNNVMKNAIAYSYEGSTIKISAERRETGGVRVRFINSGDPIPEAKRKVIFEKFYRLDAARATNRGGAGLGLAIAREIVTAHGGAITCDSTPESTVFTIDLPQGD